MTTIRLEISHPDGPGSGDLRLLIPEPANTPEQTFVGYLLPCDWELERVIELGGSQRAILASIGRCEPVVRIDCVFRPGEASAAPDLFRRHDNRFTLPSADLAAAIRGLVDAAADADEALHCIVGFLGSRFTYGPKNPQFDTPVLWCDVASGNCIDINTVFLAACYSVGIEAGYRTGYYFAQAEAGAVADGTHCWITTRTSSGIAHWDIAHCLRGGLHPIVPALNPLGGMRIAMSSGRGLSFDCLGISIGPINHFARPQWVGRDGRIAEAELTATVICDTPSLVAARHAVEPRPPARAPLRERETFTA